MNEPGHRRSGEGARVPFDLGVDMGTTYTAAAVREVGADTPRVVRLEQGRDEAPSVLLVAPGGRIEVGGEAEQRATTTPDRVVREYKRRLGDETPVVVDGAAFTADGLAAETVAWAVAQVTEIEGAAPRHVAVTHPAGWGAYRRSLFVDALAGVGLDDVVLLTEPAAAALAHAADGGVRPGDTVAVYDLGGGTFDAAVLRGDPGGPPGSVTVLGQAQGMESFGGIDVDEALFWHVCAELGDAVDALDQEDPAVLRAVAGLRRACVAAKERLSVDTEALVEVDLPGLRRRVRVSRTEFEEMIEPALHQTVDVLGEVLDAAGVAPDELARVLLVGGSSRIPLVARIVGRELGAAVSLDPDPTSAVARGAALGADIGSLPGAEPVRSVTTARRRRSVAAVTATVLRTRRGSPEPTPAGPPREEPAARPAADDPADPEATGDRTARPAVGSLAVSPAEAAPGAGEPTAPARPAVVRSAPARFPDRARAAGSGSGDRLEPAGRPAVCACGSPGSPEEEPAAEPAPAPRRWRLVLALVLGLLLLVFLVLAATVPVIDSSSAPAGHGDTPVAPLAAGPPPGGSGR